MEAGWLARTRWRRRGAWLWPAFLVSLAADAVIGHFLPPAGETQRLVGAALLGCFFNLVAIVLLSWPLGAVVRRRRPGLPTLVARDYGGTLAIAGVTVALLAAGIVHRSTLMSHRQVERDAVVRAQAWIGARAPAEFRSHLEVADTYVIEPERMYRVCVLGTRTGRTYCVIVQPRLPFDSSVRFAGYESNAVFGAGTR